MGVLLDCLANLSGAPNSLLDKQMLRVLLLMITTIKWPAHFLLTLSVSIQSCNYIDKKYFHLEIFENANIMVLILAINCITFGYLAIATDFMYVAYTDTLWHICFNHTPLANPIIKILRFSRLNERNVNLIASSH